MSQPGQLWLNHNSHLKKETKRLMLMNADPESLPDRSPVLGQVSCQIYLRGGQTLRVWLSAEAYAELESRLVDHHDYPGPQDALKDIKGLYGPDAQPLTLKLRIADISGIGKLGR